MNDIMHEGSIHKHRRIVTKQISLDLDKPCVHLWISLLLSLYTAITEVWVNIKLRLMFWSICLPASHDLEIKHTFGSKAAWLTGSGFIDPNVLTKGRLLFEPSVKPWLHSCSYERGFHHLLMPQSVFFLIHWRARPRRPHHYNQQTTRQSRHYYGCLFYFRGIYPNEISVVMSLSTSTSLFVLICLCIQS